MIFIRELIAKYEIFIGLGLMAVFFSLGFYTCHKFSQASELIEARAELQKHIELEKVYHHASENYQKLNQTLLDDNNNLNQEAHETKDNICGNKLLPRARLRILKGSRSRLAAE